MKKNKHVPVLLSIVDQLNIQPNDIIIDGTIGYGGHSTKIVEKLNKEGVLLGIDRDQTAINHCKELFKDNDNVYLSKNNYSQFIDCLKQHHLKICNKIIIDCGVSSVQFDTPERGFSYRFKGPLDMRMDQTQILTASEILNSYSEQQLSDIFYIFGELKHNSKLVKNIIEQRKLKPFKEIDDLISMIKKSYYFYNKRSNFIKHCQKVFQALRIETNQELNDLTSFLNNLKNIKNKTTSLTIAIITFHSLEDKILKKFLKENSSFKETQKKVIKPSKEEKKANSRARSAKCRIFRIP